MANAKFEIEIYGDTAKFENSLKGIDSAMSKLKSEASGLRKELKLDPTNTEKMGQLQNNLAQQMERTKAKASQLKQEMAGIDKSTPEGQKKWLNLQKQLSDNSIKAGYLERDIKQVGDALARGNWKADIDTTPATKSLDNVKRRFSALKEIGIGALRSIGSSAVSALGNGLKGWVSGAMDTQKAMIALQNTMRFKGIEGGFGKLQSEMSKLATDTNANTEDTLKLATTFVGLGDSANTASKKTSALVKANQAFGGSGENLKGVVQAYGQMSAAGKVSAENIGQLTDNNTALGASLKDTIMQMNPSLKQYGSFNEAVSKGAVSMDMLDKAMQKMADGSGGGITTIGDAWDSFNETMSTALLPTLQALTPVITALIDKMSDWGKTAGNAVTSIVKYVQELFKLLQGNGAIQAFAGAWGNVKEIFKSFGSIIGQLIQSFFGVDEASLKNKTSMEQVAETIKVVAQKIQEVTGKISEFVKGISQSEGQMNILKGVIASLGGAFVALKIVGVVQKFAGLFNVIKGGVGVIKTFSGIVKTATNFSTFVGGLKSASGAFKAFGAILSINPFVALAVAIGAVVGALVFFFTQTKTGREVWANFVEFLKTSWQSVMDFFSGIGSWFSEIWTATVEGAKGIWNGLVSWFSELIANIQNAWNGVTEFFTNLWNSIVQVTQTVWNTVTGFIGTVVQNIMNFFQPLISFYQSLWNLIFSIINLVLQLILAGVRAVVQGIQNVFQAMGNFINGVWQSILNFFKPIFQAISNFAGQVFQAIGNFASQAWSTVQGVWSVVSGWFSGIFNSVKNAVSSAFNAFGGFARSAWGAITGVFSAVGYWFSSKFDAIKGAVSSVFDAFGGFARKGWDAITNVFSGVYDFFANAFGGVKDLIDSILGGVTNTINGISKAINGVSKTVSGMFKGSLVSTMADINLNSVGQGIVQNSASNSDNRTYNTFNINAGSQDATALARAVRREFDQGRA